MIMDTAVTPDPEAVICLSVYHGEKRIRLFLGYVCQIAKVRVRINFGWVSVFTKKYLKCDFFVHMRI